MLGALFDALAPYRPTLVGTFPLGLQVPGSDLDVICEAQDLDAFEAALRAAVPGAGSRRLPLPASVSRFAWAGLPIEVFAQPLAVERQLGFRHMILEGRLLATFGEPLRRRVRAHKLGGMKTEPAFADALGLEGDPYRALLTLEDLAASALRARFRSRVPDG